MTADRAKHMKTTPMLFSADLVNALIDGSKTQTRRPISNQNLVGKCGEVNIWAITKAMWERISKERPVSWGIRRLCPFGQPGDLIWVRETTEADDDTSDCVTLSRYCADKGRVLSVCSRRKYSGPVIAHWDYSRPTRPSIHMPRWASRLTLKITDVRVERIKDISADDIRAEGIKPRFPITDQFTSGILTGQFMDLWESAYGDKSWHSNPWVWCLNFQVIHENIDRYIEQSETVSA